MAGPRARRQGGRLTIVRAGTGSLQESVAHQIYGNAVIRCVMAQPQAAIIEEFAHDFAVAAAPVGLPLRLDRAAIGAPCALEAEVRIASQQ